MNISLSQHGLSGLNKLQSVRIKRFKRITDAAFDLTDVNILVGGNNSGKSSIIQGLHFGVGLLQTVALAGKLPIASPSVSTSLNPNQLIYSPSEDVYALGPGGKLLEEEDEAISFKFNLVSGDECSVTARKGRNRNILVGITNAQTARNLSSLENPFSIFSPGLAGIVKREPYVSDGVLLRTLARGDANLVLRNILLRLSGTSQWNSFLNDLHDVFPNVELHVVFHAQTDEVIDVQIKTREELVPLEIAGTGVLQTIQILSYIHRFDPSIIVLDEPDSHLHPNNQRLLCALLRKVAEDRGTQILLTTHSRHVVDAMGFTSNFLWVRNGIVDVAGQDDEIGILLDIGALDIKERAGQPGIEAVVLTEDEITKPLETVLASSGFDLSKTSVLPYYGIAATKQLRPLIKVIQSINPRAKLLVHRDRDFLTDDEVDVWKKDIRNLNIEPFVTKGRDIKSCFISSMYLAEVNPGVNENDFQSLVEHVIDRMRDKIIEDYVNGRLDVARKSNRLGSINHGSLAVEAQRVVAENIHRFCGKPVFRALRAEFQVRYSQNMVTFVQSDKLQDDVLKGFSLKAFRSQ